MEYYDESYDYIITKPELNEDLLMHFGVKGMRWGHRKQRPVSLGRRVRSANDKFVSNYNKKHKGKDPRKSVGYKLASGPFGQAGLKAGQRHQAKKAAKANGSLSSDQKKERAKKIAKGAAIAAGVAVGAMAMHTFVTSPYAKGNRMYVKGKTKEALYKAGRKFADSVVQRRQRKAAKAYTKTLPRIGAKKVIDTTYKDLSTGVSTHVKKNRNALKTAAAIAGAAAGTAATTYTTAKTVQDLKKKKKKS